jgi:alpha-glucuronidase
MTFRVLAVVALAACGSLMAETGRDAWLRYPELDAATARTYRETVPAVVAAIGDSPMLVSARSEIGRGVRGMLGRTLREDSKLPAESAIVIGSFEALRAAAPELAPGNPLSEDAYRLRTVTIKGVRYVVIAGGGPRGALYGAFAYLRKIQLREPVVNLNEEQAPYAPVRWTNEWNNLDGTIERGYGGRSIFFDGGKVRADLTRAGEYARLLASLGINGCSVTNVNANPKSMDPAFIVKMGRIADAFRPWGVRMVLSVDFGSPKTVGGLDTFDPLDEKVIAFWRNKMDEFYRSMPDLGGIVLKADSEGRVGPSAYNRTHADAANVVARALKPHGGLLFYRGFVYDHRMDWRNLKNDRARAAWDNFQPLDGKFDDNVAIQIKHGPIDFQVREPASPLFGALEKTNQAIELQITQEYFGQARHTVFLVPMWKEALDFDMHAAGANTPVKALVAGKVFKRPMGGFIGVANVGMDENWLGNHMSQANLYGFARLAWNPDLTSERIIDEWTRLTFGPDPKVVSTVKAIQLASWRNFENYSGPLGLQTLSDMTGTHYGPAVDASERNGWGQWHRADEQGVGMDRTAAGTGFISQYRPEVARVYESLATCPDELLLFMHHVPYTYKLHSGKTVIQHLYDSHYEGATATAGYVPSWKSLAGLVDEPRYREVLVQLEYQAGHARVWRDAVVSWFFKESSIPDAQNRAGHAPNRVEAEDLKLEGYAPMAVLPWETASGGKGVQCMAERCTAAHKFSGAAGWYMLRVQYFDTNDGVSRFKLFVNSQQVDEWEANDHFAARKPDGASSTSRVVRAMALRPGDEIRIEGVTNARDRAAFDYIEIEPAREN